MRLINFIFDGLYYGIIEPFFIFLARVLEVILLEPLNYFQVPVILQIMLLAMFTALISFAIRHKLKVDMHTRQFRKEFIAKREKQKNIDMLGDWKSRDTMYRFTDKELDEDFNVHLAHRYSQFVMSYLLPLFLVLAWLNSVFSAEKLTLLHGTPFVVSLGINSPGIQGLSVTFVFLVSYSISLLAGFQLKRIASEKKALGVDG